MHNLFKKIINSEIEAKEYGFYWESIDQLLKQVISECQEIEEASLSQDLEHLQEEIGDLLYATVCLSIFCQQDPLATLEQGYEKFLTRFSILKELVREDGLVNLQGKTLKQALSYWDKAKKIAEPIC